MIEVVTLDGTTLAINEDHIAIVGPFVVDGAPMVGVVKIHLVNGAALAVRSTINDLFASRRIIA